jgi:MFS family permease
VRRVPALDAWLPRSPGLRRYATANLLNTVGSGLYLTCSFLAFTRGLGFDASFVATSIGVGFAAGMPCALVAGRLSDRHGPKLVYCCLLAAQAVLMVCLAAVGTPTVFVVLVLLSGVADRSLAATAGPLVHALSARDDRSVNRAHLRVSTNIGIAAGSALGSVALVVDERSGYSAVLAANGFFFLVALVLVARISVPGPGPDAPSSTARQSSAIPRPSYVWATAGNALMSIHPVLLSVGLPLWLASAHVLPLWTLSVVVVVNTAVVVIFQVPAARRVVDAARARAAVLAAAASLVFSCVAISALDAGGLLLAAGLVGVWALSFTVGELLQSTASFYMSFELAPDELQGTYQSFWSLGPSLARAAGPVAVTTALGVLGAPGWWLIGLVIAVGALVCAAVLRNVPDEGPTPVGGAA